MKPRLVQACAVVLAVVGLLTLQVPSRADAGAERIPGEILVRLKPNLDSGQRWAEVSSAVGNAVSYNSALHTYRVKLRGGLTIERALASLDSRPEVDFAQPNYVIRVFATPNDPSYATKQFAPQKTKADAAWDIWNPQQQVVIAIIDTGIDNTHPDLTKKILRDAAGIVGFDAFTGKRDPGLDLHGHGTHCAGIAAAETNNGIGVAGIAGWNGQPGSDTTHVKLMPVKVLNGSGQGTSQTVADGITWAADNGAKVISLSLGGGPDPVMNTAVQHAWNLGCVVCAAAGNKLEDHAARLGI